MVLGHYLSYIKVTASKADAGSTEGICGNFDGIHNNEFEGVCRKKKSAQCVEDFVKSWT